ncbi:molybdopterin-dependent oxidoreductase [Fusobacteria bacterium ZRK30]|nr:molybdopterin-dependent oxidoreductase [Fusobacteria bacterium ZRK30]
MLAARKNNVKIVTVDPRINESSKFADIHISPNPSTDGALAMAVTKYIIHNKGYEKEYLKKHVVGFEEYFKYLNGLTMEYLVKETGVFSAVSILIKHFLKT